MHNETDPKRKIISEEDFREKSRRSFLIGLAGVGLVCSPISGLCCVGPQQTTLKAKLGITEKDTCGDCMCTCICTTCAQCRIARELKARGIYTHEQMNGQLPSTLAPSNMTFVKAR